VTPQQWLVKHGRKPYVTDLYPNWYWADFDNYIPDDPENEADEIDFHIPHPVFMLLKGHLTYPEVKIYKSAEEALADFEQAFATAVIAGWNPNQEEVSCFPSQVQGIRHTHL
jgi:hypothetical protein